jgi:hypothetical protein
MISDTILDKPVVDTYKEHINHIHIWKNCSECYKRVRAVKKNYPNYNGINSEVTLSSYEGLRNPLE